MKKLKASLAVTVALAFGLSACGGSKTKAVESNKQVQQDATQAQQIVDACLAKNNVITNLHGVVNCIAPKGHSQALLSCSINHMKDIHNKQVFEQDLVVCAEQNR